MEINFIAGSFEDNSGNGNDAETETFYIDGPDLYGTNFNIIETEANAGDEITVEVTIHNDGLVAYSQFGVRCYISRDPHIEHGEDAFLHYESIPGLDPNADVTFVETMRLPSAGNDVYDGDGVYYIGMVVDGDNQNSETDENNNSNRGTYLDREDLVINNTDAPDKPDLVGQFASIPMDAQIFPDQIDRVSVTVVNRTEIDARGRISIQLFLSEDQQLNDYFPYGDRKAGGLANVSINLGELDAKTFKVPFFSPDSLAPGEYYLLAKVDYSDTMSEEDEDNNVIVSPATYQWTRKVGEGGAKKLTLYDQGVAVTFRMNGGGYAIIDPGDEGFNIVMEETGEKSRLKMSGRPNETYRIDNVTCTGDLKGIEGTDSFLKGTMTILGTTGEIKLGDIDDEHVITVGGDASSPPMKVQFGHVTDLVLDTQTPIKQLNAQSWGDAGGTPDRISAPWIGKLQVAGDFDADLVLSGAGAPKDTLGNVKINGVLNGGNWDITGGASNITAGGTTAAWSAAFTGDVAKAKFTGDFGGTLAAQRISKLDVLGNLDGATIRLNPTAGDAIAQTTVLGKLKITGWMEDSQIRAFGDIGKAQIGAMRGSTLFAGVRNYVTDLPSAAAHFSHASTIADLKIKGVAGATHAFEDSYVAASVLNKVQVRNCLTDNGGTTFGLACNDLGRFQRFEPDGKYKWPNNSDPGGPPPDGDFVVRVI
jgi:hypothetical protein